MIEARSPSIFLNGLAHRATDHLRYRDGALRCELGICRLGQGFPVEITRSTATVNGARAQAVAVILDAKVKLRPDDA